MLQLRCTGKVIKGLSLKSDDLSEVKKNDTILGNWYVNIFTIDRRKTFLFVNERTLLSFIVFGIKKSNINKIHSTFIHGIAQLLSIEEIEKNLIESVLDDYIEMEFTKTDSRKILGNMNDLMYLYKHFIYNAGGLKQCEVGEIILRINRTPQRNIDWAYSIEAVKEILKLKRA